MKGVSYPPESCPHPVDRVASDGVCTACGSTAVERVRALADELAKFGGTEDVATVNRIRRALDGSG